MANRKLVEMLKVSFEKQYEKYGLLTPQHTAEDLIANGVTTADKREAVGDRLSATGVTSGGDTDVLARLEELGRLFVEYTGDPRGPMGRACVPLEEEVLLMPKITDVDGGEWIPVNADALHELVDKFKKQRRKQTATRNKLKELISSCYMPITTRDGITTGEYRISSDIAERIADHLIANSETAQEWISVKDRLPDINEIVLATLREPVKRLNHPYGEKILLLYRTKSNYVHGTVTKWERPYGAETIDYDDVVTHWMPLPEPQEGVTES